METQESVLEFWFGQELDDKRVARQQSKLWWMKHAETDAMIRERFEASVAGAAEGALDGWRTTARGCLALIILTDQFPRNMYRNTPQSFAFDTFARAICRDGLEQGFDRQLRPIERVFFYLPLEHSEALEDQERAVALFEALVRDAGPEGGEDFEGFLDYARRHRDVVMRFGRFPHRNVILGRPSTAEEIEFLRQPGSSF